MRELSLNILDIAKNSVKAGAKQIDIEITVHSAEDELTIAISDDGCGMSPEFLVQVTDPFTTTRTTRKVGLGIPLFKMAAESAGGKFEIQSQVGKGTIVTATFQLSHIDRMPLGNVSETMAVLIQGSPEIEFTLKFQVDAEQYVFDTRLVRKELDGIPIETADIVTFLQEMIEENMKNISGGMNL